MSQHTEVELVEDLPPGKYFAAILVLPEVEEYGELNWEYFRAEFQITSGEHEGRSVTYSAPFNQKVTTKSRLGRLVRSMFPDQTSGKYQFEKMLQKPCEIECELDDEGFLKVKDIRRLGPDEKPY
jgi:hypothetical protein